MEGSSIAPPTGTSFPSVQKPSSYSQYATSPAGLYPPFLSVGGPTTPIGAPRPGKTKPRPVQPSARPAVVQPMAQPSVQQYAQPLAPQVRPYSAGVPFTRPDLYSGQEFVPRELPRYRGTRGRGQRRRELKLEVPFQDQSSAQAWIDTLGLPEWKGDIRSAANAYYSTKGRNPWNSLVRYHSERSPGMFLPRRAQTLSPAYRAAGELCSPQQLNCSEEERVYTAGEVWRDYYTQLGEAIRRGDKAALAELTGTFQRRPAPPSAVLGRLPSNYGSYVSQGFNRSSSQRAPALRGSYGYGY